jgi:AbrB family looped-hinge helix DNA binding protein
MNAVTRLTIKNQTTIPEPVRKALGLKAGDYVEFVVRGNKASVHKAARRLADETLFKLAQADAMRDWDTPEDDDAFRDL